MQLSIIIPTLNEEKVLEKTLRTLKSLNAVDHEIIVSDGHSADRTLEIARRYADVVVEHDGQTRQNISMGRNAGAAVAKGQYLLFLDADVIIPNPNDFFTKALTIFRKGRKLVALTVFLKVLPENVTVSDKLFFGLVNLQTQFCNNVLHTGASVGEFQMISADAFRQVGGYDENLTVGEDHDLFNRLGKIGNTWTASGLEVFHTSRRAHKVGWPKLLATWWINFLYIKLFKRSFSKEWTAIR